MPRRIFTARDLAPLRKITEKILEKQPDATVVAAAAGPFKRRIQKPEHEERAEVRLPVDIETSTNREGVPLHEIATELKKEVPEISGISVTPGGVTLKFDREPTVAQRRKIDALLQNRERLESLKPGIRGTTTPEAGVARPKLAEEDVQRILRDPETSDAAWLKAFRAHAVEQLIEPTVRSPVPGRTTPAVEVERTVEEVRTRAADRLEPLPLVEPLDGTPEQPAASPPPKKRTRKKK